MAQVFPDFALAGQGSPSRYRRYESGRGLNYVECDHNLAAVLDLHLDEATRAWAGERLLALGERAGTELVRRADVYDAAGHELERYDRLGRDVSRVAHHPDWLANLNEVFDFGLVGWNHNPATRERFGRAPAQLLAAFDYVVGQADMALCCPVELAHGSVVVLERFAEPAQRERLLPAICALRGDARLQVAQVATEVTGGSDVGASRTEAHQLAGGSWQLRGEKWFASNVGADLIVTLARVDPHASGTKGLALFVVPRRRSDGSANAVSIRRLKDKMGTIGVPTGELIFDGAEAWLVGDPAHGFRYMAEMLNHTRFWNGVGSVGVMRRAFLEAAVYCARRESFGTTLDAFPMMRERLVWLHVDLAATTAMLFHAAAALDAVFTGDLDGADHLRFRSLAPMLKYRAGEQSVDFARAAIEMLGGNGYVATFGTPRLLRDAQVNPIWEGTSNICALDFWRACTRQNGHEAVIRGAERLLGQITTDAGARLADAARDALEDLRAAIEALQAAPRARQEQQARRLTDLAADALALAALAREADHEARQGNYAKALTGELFAMRMGMAADRAALATRGFEAVPDAYPMLFAHAGCGEDDYRRALRAAERVAA
jgi:alkylation response protein AidB-like acyl-CoA dehydrogenase